VRLVLRDEPDLLIFDKVMSCLNGVEAARRIGAKNPRTRMLCLSSRDDAHSVREAFDAGVHGYVAKRSGFDEVVEAIDRVLRNGYYVSPNIAHVLVDGFRSRHDVPSPNVPALTAREREVARLYAEGRSTREIAESLNVSMKTIGTHREHIMDKVGARSIAQLTHYAIREGLVLLGD
jgi:DNA-binding NarL/FixJ family response regulator